MKTMRAGVPLIAVAVLAVAAIVRLAGQDADGNFDEEQTRARRLLSSKWAEYLSGSGLNANIRMSGTSSAYVNLHTIERGHALATLPFTSNRFQIMVNDPTQDLSEVADISTQSETAVAGFGSNVIVTFNDSGAFQVVPSFMGYSRSTDEGRTFNDLGPVPPFAVPATQINNGDPAVVADRAGNFYTAHLTSVQTPAVRPTGFSSVIGIHKSTDGGLTWGPTVFPAAPGVRANSGQDKELITVDTSGGAFDGNVYVTWTSIGGTFTPPTPPPTPAIYLSRSTDHGVTFSVPIQVSPSGDTVQGSEPAVGPNGDVYVTWFRYSGASPGPGLPPPGRAIMIAKSTNGGLSFGPAVEVAAITPIGFGATATQPRLHGNFRVNSFPRIDVNPVSGDVYIVYNANPEGPDAADVFFTRSGDGGASWSRPLRVNDDPGANDQYFPDLAVNGHGVIEVIWYDQRHDPENQRINVYKARSTNGGLSFGPNQKVTLTAFAPAVGFDPLVNPTYMGDYIDIKAITTPGGRGSTFLLSWADFRRIITTNGGTRGDQDVFFAID